MRKHLWVLLAYIALSLVLTWPLAAHFATHVPGDGIDDPSLAWNLWWIKHALVEHPQNPFLVDWQFWPIGINLAFYTLTVLNGMLGIPLQVVFGVVPTYNLLLLASFVLSGFGAYLLCLDFVDGRRKTKDEGRRTEDRGSGSAAVPLSSVVGCFIGGALLAFASAKLFYAALGQGNIASSQWAPFAALYIVRAMRPQGRVRDAALAALFIVLQAYAELTFASFLAIFAGVAVVFRIAYFVFGIWREKRGNSSTRHSSLVTRHSPLVRFALIAALSAIGIAPILANMLPDLQTEGDFFTSGGGFADLFSADLAGYVLPTQLHPVFGGLIRSVANNSAPRPDGSHFPVNKGQQVYAGYVALALAGVGLWSGRRRSDTWLWAFSALVFFLLTLGPSLRVGGYDLHVPLPFDLIAQLPFFKGNRYPSRYSVMLLLSLAPLAALGASRIANSVWRLASRRRNASHSSRLLLPLSTCLLISVVLFEHLSVPLPLSDLRVPALYDRIAAEAGDFAVLELPPGWRNGARVAGKQDIVIMQQLWNQVSHGKRLLGGNTSRNPEYKFQFFSEDPTLARLIAPTNAADVPQHEALRAALAASPITPAEARRARDWAATWAVRYVMVHRDKLPAETEEALRQLLPVTLVGESGNLALYRLTGDLAPPTRFLVGTDVGRMVLAEGWSPAGLGEPVYAERLEARLLLPLGPQARQLQLDMWALAPGQSVTLVVDGQPVATQPLTTERSLLTFDLPPSDAARPPVSDVRLRFAALAPVAQATQSAQATKPAGIPGPSALVVRSAGQETGDFAHIYADGVDLSPNRRGYNLVAWRPDDGRLLGTEAFDTHGDPAASARLAAWIAGLPLGAVVAGAVRDEASMNLGADAVDALRSLGASTDLRNHFRWGHAFIGETGAAPGSAHEQASGMNVAQVASGLPITAPQAVAALAEVSILE